MAKPAKRKRKPAAQQYGSYLFEIVETEPHYSFSVGDVLSGPGRYAEYLHPELSAVCVRPERLKGRLTRFVFIGKREIEAELNSTHGSLRGEHGLIGTLTMRGDFNSYLGSLPFDTALALGPMLALQAYRYVYMSGQALFRGRANIHSIGFYRSFDPDDA